MSKLFPLFIESQSTFCSKAGWLQYIMRHISGTSIQRNIPTLHNYDQ